jgi:putative PIN family toxin of toxin-antitoxin system
MTSNRFVIDTNALVSTALIQRSVSRQAFNYAFAHGMLLLSSATFAEFQEVLYGPRFDKYLTDAERQEFLVAVLKVMQTVKSEESIRICRAPKDDKFLEVAVNGQATSLITGDQDLLILHSFRSIPIVMPRTFVDSMP